MAQGPSSRELAALYEQVSELYSAGKFAEAILLAERIIALEQRKGTDHPFYAIALAWLGAIYREQGLYPEAEPLFLTALRVAERALGPDHPEVSRLLNNLAGLYEAQGRFAESEPLFARSLSIREKTLGPNHSEVVTSLINIAQVDQRLGRYADAEQRYKRSLVILESTPDRDQRNAPLRGTILNNLAELYREQGRYVDAEPLYKLSLEIRENALGFGHPYVGTTLNNLGLLYQAQERYPEAVAAFERSLAIREQALGPDHVDVAASLVNIAAILHFGGNHLEAGKLYELAIGIFEKKFGPDHPHVGHALSNLAAAYERLGRYPDAEQLQTRSLRIREKALGPDHPDVGASLINLAVLNQELGHYGDAEAHYKRALPILENALGPDHPHVRTALNNLASLYFRQEEWGRAVEYFQGAEAVTVRRMRLGSKTVGPELISEMSSNSRAALRILVKAVHRLAQAEKSRAEELMQQAFKTTQLILTSAASMSVALMAARHAKGRTALSELVRKRQDLIGELRASDKQLIATRFQFPGKRDANSEKALAAQLSFIKSRIDEIDSTLRRDFPDYAAFANPEPLSISEVQARLHVDEALVLFLDTPEHSPAPEETFVWVVTRNRSGWVCKSIGTKGLTKSVQALRCGLDYRGAWATPRCSDLLGIVYTEADYMAGKLLPFDLVRAHEVFRTLFGQISEISDSKHLLVVPSGPLTQLPFHVLVTEMPDPGRGQLESLRNAAWLLRSHAITILPAVSSLEALRQHAVGSRATKPLVGFGNPLLDGPDWRYKVQADAARQKQRCHEKMRIGVRSGLGTHGGAQRVAQRGGLADIMDIRARVPLPETADELCAAASALGAGADDIYLGARATERAVKALSDSGALSAYRVVHFATHGCLAGEMHDDAEPGLILTPPDKATPEDDGYLTASEIAGLKLDAEWVILSACNTAAGGAQEAEALSGLARAFFYAGARAVLVSHWAVNSVSTVRLITKTLDTVSTDRRIGRAEALRRAMLEMINFGEPHEAHPSCWGPFVLVGEGAASE